MLSEQSFFGPPVHVPRRHRSAESKVQRLPSSHGLASGSVIPLQRPTRQRSVVVQQLRSSHAWPSGIAVPTHNPTALHRSLALQALPSSQVLPAGSSRVPETHAFVVELQ